MSRRFRPMGVFLLMLWLPPFALFALRMGGCSVVDVDPLRTSLHAPASEAGHSAPEAEGVSL